MYIRVDAVTYHSPVKEGNQNKPTNNRLCPKETNGNKRQETQESNTDEHNEFHPHQKLVVFSAHQEPSW